MSERFIQFGADGDKIPYRPGEPIDVTVGGEDGWQLVIQHADDGRESIEVIAPSESERFACCAACIAYSDTLPREDEG